MAIYMYPGPNMWMHKLVLRCIHIYTIHRFINQTSSQNVVKVSWSFQCEQSPGNGNCLGIFIDPI